MQNACNCKHNIPVGQKYVNNYKNKIKINPVDIMLKIFYN